VLKSVASFFIMDQLNDFYVHLPSNNISGSDSNTVCNYVSQLARPIQLEGEWEVALTEISYTASWYDIHKECNCTIYSFHYDLTESTKMTTQSIFPINFSALDDISVMDMMYGVLRWSIRIPPGLYTVDGLIEFLNTSMLTQGKSGGERSQALAPALEMGRDGYIKAYSGKIKDGGKELDTFMIIDGDAADLLGFRWDPFRPFFDEDEGRKMYTSPDRAQLKRGCFCMFVYTDIIRGLHVGDTMSNLLRVVDIPNEYKLGSQVTYRYQTPEYKRLVSNYIQSINVYIKDDCGSDIPFEFGRTIVTLHFRKIRQLGS
jgi:hypothetical protein